MTEKSVHLAGVHVGLVFLGQLVGVVVLLHNWGEQGGKQGVALFISSVDTDTRVQVHYTGVDAVLKDSSTGSLLVLQLFKYLASEVLLQCGLDLRFVEISWKRVGTFVRHSMVTCVNNDSKSQRITPNAWRVTLNLEDVRVRRSTHDDNFRLHTASAQRTLPKGSACHISVGFGWASESFVSLIVKCQPSV